MNFLDADIFFEVYKIILVLFFFFPLLNFLKSNYTFQRYSFFFGRIVMPFVVKHMKEE